MNQATELKVLIISAEVAPYAKSGGLGDVAGSLPKALKKHGVDVRIVLPKYKSIKSEHIMDLKYLGDFDTRLSWRKQKAGILLKEADTPVYFIENDYYFGRDGLYGFDDDNERFAFFCRAAVDMLPFIDFCPDIIHCNDWQTGPISLILKETYKKLPFFKNIKTLYTVHNLQYQGNFSPETLEMLDIPQYFYDNGSVEFFGSISFMKMGLMFSDMISTVSNTYASEIQTEQYGYGLDGVLRLKSDKLRGILNGIDFDANDPRVDKRIEVNYDIATRDLKKENKKLFQKRFGLEERDVPMVSIVSRLADQKGLDILVSIFEQMMNENDMQFVVLGTGERRYEDMFRYFASKYPGKISANILFDDTLAQRIYASSDIFLMPSLFEPCGLGQMFSLRYGTVPVVRRTGGLADTIVNYNSETGKGNGFVFEDYNEQGLLWAIREALNTYYNGDWDTVVKNAMSEDYSWDNSAKTYLDLYNEMLLNK